MLIQCYGNYIKKNRIILNLSQKELAKKLNVSEASVSKWESDVVRLELTNLVSLSNLFGVTVDDFLHQRYNDNFDINERYPILNKLSNIDYYIDTDSETIANEFLLACDYMFKLVDKVGEDKISTSEKKDLEKLFKTLIHSLVYENFYPCYEDKLLGVKVDNFSRNEFIPLTIENLSYFLSDNDLKNKKIIYNIPLDNLILKLRSFDLMYDISRYYNFDEQMLLCAIKNKNWNLCLVCLIKGIKLTDERTHKKLINKILSKVGDINEKI